MLLFSFDYLIGWFYGDSDVGDSDVGDLKMVPIFECWWRNSDFSDIFWMMVTDANVKR